MRERTCCFTGHRDIPADKRDEIAAKLEQTLVELIHAGIRISEPVEH